MNVSNYNKMIKNMTFFAKLNVINFNSIFTIPKEKPSTASFLKSVLIKFWKVCEVKVISEKRFCIT